MGEILTLIGYLALEFLAALPVRIRPDRAGKRNRWIGLAILLILLGGIGFLVAMILSL